MKRNTFYIACENDEDYGNYYIVSIKTPTFLKKYPTTFTMKTFDNKAFGFCGKDFERISGIKLTPGTYKKFKLVEAK